MRSTLSRPPEAAAPSTFVDALPRTLPVDDVLRDAQRQSAAGNVHLAGIELAPQRLGSGALQRLDLTLFVQGRYTAVVGLLGDLMDRHAGMVIRQLSFRRVRQSDLVDARLDVTLAAQPEAP